MLAILVTTIIYTQTLAEVVKGLDLSFHYGVSSYAGDGDYNDYGVSLSKDGFGFVISKDDKEGSDLAATITYAVDFDL